MARKQRSTRKSLHLENLEERLCLSSPPVGVTPTGPDSATQAHLSAAYGQLPLSFEANQGQTDSQVNFLSRGNGFSLFLTPTKAVLSLKQGNTSNVVGMRIVGANPASRAMGLDKQAGVSNYFIGNDPSKWHTDVPNYAKVDYKSVYRGIDLVYHGNQKQLEYDFVVAPGANPRAIRLAFDGVRSASLDRAGNLVLHTSGGEVVEHAPIVYQEVNGQHKAVAGRYVLLGNDQMGFQIGRYDHSKPLVIDPVLSYSTYLGGGQDDAGNAIAVDGSGNAYITGSTGSNNFPRKNPLQSENAGGGSDAFVTRLNAAGTGLVYSTFLGGTGYDQGIGIAVDSAGNAYVTGTTGSTDFPMSHAAQGASGGQWDAFVARLNASGSALVYSTYLGGSGREDRPDNFSYGGGIAVDVSGNAYVTGTTASTNFPTTPGAFQTTPAGAKEAFVTKFAPAGAIVYSSYFGGAGSDSAFGIAVDSSGNSYVTGNTTSTNLPTTPGAFQTAIAGKQSAFVAKFNPTGSGLVYSTYLGGAYYQTGTAIALDGSGNAYVAGVTTSTNFPTTSGAYQTALSGFSDAFVTKMNSTGTQLLYSTYFGGNDTDIAYGIAVDTNGNAYITGSTPSTNLPLRNAFQPAYGGGTDAFVAKLNPLGSGDASLVYSSYLGGSAQEQGIAIAADSVGSVYLTGYTTSIDFPTNNPFQAQKKGGSDAFVTKITGS